ncbi:MAG: D-alanyl-D-alanine carboxypeptidase, partial [Clostridia bacterium]|nr:D-alanyl-D-alanine carboxypeptidase [Clostridia bacterium]
MKKAICLVLCALLLAPSCLAAAAAAASPLAGIAAPSAVLMHPSGEILFEKNPHEKRHPASVTKIMTMLLVMEAIDRGEIKLTDMVTGSA